MAFACTLPGLQRKHGAKHVRWSELRFLGYVAIQEHQDNQRVNMEFRPEAFNTLNHTNFQLPGSSGSNNRTDSSNSAGGWDVESAQPAVWLEDRFLTRLRPYLGVCSAGAGPILILAGCNASTLLYAVPRCDASAGFCWVILSGWAVGTNRRQHRGQVRVTPGRELPNLSLSILKLMGLWSVRFIRTDRDGLASTILPGNIYHISVNDDVYFPVSESVIIDLDTTLDTDGQPILNSSEH